MDEKVMGFLEKMYSDMTNRFEKIENHLTKIENDNHKHFTALYDGYKQSIEGINEIKEEVSKHEEIIIKRIK